MTNTELSAPAAKTLRTIERMGGEVNFFAGVKGLDSRSERSLIDQGMITEPHTCGGEDDQPCTIAHATLSQKSYRKVYRRTQLTDTGIAWLAANPT